MTITAADLTAVILAGGQGRRMGGEDKCLLEFAGKRAFGFLQPAIISPTIRRPGIRDWDLPVLMKGN